MIHTRHILALAVSICTASAAFGQNLILNGGFEDDGQVGFTISTGVVTNAISNWSLQTTSSSSQYTVFSAPGMNEPNPADGTHLLNIGGFGTTKGVGTLWQDFATTAGTAYDVTFYFGRGNNDPVPMEYVSVEATTFDITAGSPSGPALMVFDAGNAPATGPVSNLALAAFQFTATGNTSRLFLRDMTTGNGASLQLDAVAVAASAAAVPEPSAALLAIASGTALLMMRRRRAMI